MPANEEELEEFLEAGHVFDMDEDGNLSITIVSQGALQANLFNFSRYQATRRHQLKCRPIGRPHDNRPIHLRDGFR